MTRAQRRAAARKAAGTNRAKVQPVIVEPLAHGQGRPTKAANGYSVTKWDAPSSEIVAKATVAMNITLPSDLSSEKNKQLKVGRVLLWLGLKPSVTGAVKACVTETQKDPASAFQIALAIADSSKEVSAAMYMQAFRGVPLEDFVKDLTIYLYSEAALKAGDVVVHLEVEHVKPLFDDFFTPVF